MKNDYALSPKVFLRTKKNYAVKFPEYLHMTKPHPCSSGQNRSQIRMVNTKLHVHC